MKIKIIKSPNHSIKYRNKKNIKFIVLHYTGMQSERVSIERLTNKKSKVKCRFAFLLEKSNEKERRRRRRRKRRSRRRRTGKHIALSWASQSDLAEYGKFSGGEGHTVHRSNRRHRTHLH